MSEQEQTPQDVLRDVLASSREIADRLRAERDALRKRISDEWLSLTAALGNYAHPGLSLSENVVELHERLTEALADVERLHAERDALRLAVAKLEDERKFWAGGDAMARLKANDLRAEVERLERARLRSGDWLTLDKLDAEVAAAKDGQIEALRENVDLLAEVSRSHAAILALTGEGR